MGETGTNNLKARVGLWTLALPLLSGCTSLPPFQLSDHLHRNEHDGPRFAALVRHIQCEVLRAANNSIINQNAEVLTKFDYVATALLTVDVVETNGLDPSINFIRPYSMPASNLTVAVGFELNGTNHRQFSYAFPIPLVTDNGRILQPDGQCANEERSKSGLGGNLGLADIMDGGLESIAATMQTVPTTKTASQKNWIFGSTVDFAIVEGIGGGPNWTLKNFKAGPPSMMGGVAAGSGNGSGNTPQQGWLNANRTVKDTLNISFIPSKATLPAGLKLSPEVAQATRDSDLRKAESDGQEFNARMILQNLLSSGN